MSSTACDSTSFENQHNEVHVAVGGIHPMGHFAHLGYSGFDPIFMMHHAAIDRHVALWQAIHFNASMFTANYTVPEGQFATAPGTVITANSPLKPFYADTNGAFITPHSARDIATFGYTYPELQGNYSSREELSRAVTVQVNRLYGPKPTAVHRRHVHGTTPSKEYFVRISVEKSEVALPAAVNVWLGAAFAGRLLLLESPRRGVVHGEVALQRVLAAANVAPDAVRGHLERYLRWEVTKVMPAIQ